MWMKVQRHKFHLLIYPACLMVEIENKRIAPFILHFFFE